jgi:hypothetical protein
LRFAIGYAPSDIDSPVAVFVETAEGVLFQRRGDIDLQQLDRPLGSRPQDGLGGDVIGPGAPQYFDAILDSFSTKFFIRTMADLEPDVLASMLLAEENWALLPRPHSAQTVGAS